MSSTHINIDAASAHFKSADPVMYQLLQQALTAEFPIAIPIAKNPEQHFSSIASSIISQQISTQAAAAVKSRVVALVGDLKPANILQYNFDTLKACGLSTQKTKYLLNSAEIWQSGQVDYKNFSLMEDTEVIAELTKLYGIGVWTAEMFLMFSLGRPNVFSYGDLGLMNSLYHNYKYQKHWTRKIEATVGSWSPHKTAASLALWHTVDNGPVLL